MFSSYGYLGQPVLLANISVYCWVQIKLLLLLMMPGQSRVETARQGITLLKPDSPLRVWILNALGCKKFKIVNKPERNLTLEGDDWRDIVPAWRFYSIFQFLWIKIDHNQGDIHYNSVETECNYHDFRDYIMIEIFVQLTQFK